MLFPTHLVAAFVLGRRWDLSVPPLVAGAAFPDLVDKPAAMVGLVDLYQTAGHSVALLVVGFAVVFVRRALAPFWIGWASHLLLDAAHMILNGRPDDILFLAWPAVEHTPAVDLPPIEFFLQYLWTPSFYAEFVVWGLLAYVLVADRE
ncbi:metal-dependent hydrolase [Haloplanus rubicundus]|uniref:Metal-dependent hydrolase n=1 Tax=Haloplanus rubicundus TaxID=1547898 RepID=A0A345ED74_9EURY|nr:metal-dependent hydrolase [Haloplanus rubicundus]AXG10146.1 metal-dependent hydrolase [Haloplanus rubicundus]